jgi:5-methyltetrahydrofolate--homocysteine methyltransferase
MIIIGERINTSRKGIAEAVRKKDSEFIKIEAKKQANLGADFIDVNCGTNISTEVEDLKWVVDVAQSAVDKPLCLDSPNHKAIEAGLSVHKGRAFINSVTAEKKRIDAILPFVKKNDCFLVGLAMVDTGVPTTAEERLQAAGQILKAVERYGINKDMLYIDAVVQSVATDSRQGIEFLKALQLIKLTFGLKTIAGLSNVSFGLPKRSVLNASFLAMAIAFGLDAAIIDVTDPRIYSTLKAANTLVGNDQFCQEYISAFRSGKL